MKLFMSELLKVEMVEKILCSHVFQQKMVVYSTVVKEQITFVEE